jgi:hypothetical protein
MRLNACKSFHTFLLGIEYDIEHYYMPLIRDLCRRKRGKRKDTTTDKEAPGKDEHESSAASSASQRSGHSREYGTDEANQTRRRRARDKFNEVEARAHSLGEWLDAFAELAAASGPTVPTCAVRSRLRHVIRSESLVESMMAVLRFRSSGEFDSDPATLLAHRITRLELRNNLLFGRTQAINDPLRSAPSRLPEELGDQ